MKSEDLYKHLLYSGYTTYRPDAEDGIFRAANHEMRTSHFPEDDLIPYEALTKGEVILKVPTMKGVVEKKIQAWNDGEFIYAYRLQKERARFRKTGDTFIKDDRLCRTAEKCQDYGYLVSIYKLPIKDATVFEQCKGHNGQHYFRYECLTENAKDYWYQLYNGFPARNTAGWWDAKHLHTLSESLEKALKITSWKFLQDENLAYIDIRVSSMTGDFLFRHTDGTAIPNEKLTKLLKWNAEDYARYLKECK